MNFCIFFRTPAGQDHLAPLVDVRFDRDALPRNSQGPKISTGNFKTETCSSTYTSTCHLFSSTLSYIFVIELRLSAAQLSPVTEAFSKKSAHSISVTFWKIVRSFVPTSKQYT